MHRLSVERTVGRELAPMLYRSLKVEAEELHDDRSRTDIAVDGSTLYITIEATDLVALRAAANTWLSLLQLANRTAGISQAGY